MQQHVWKLQTLVFCIIFLNFPENIKKLKVNTIQFRNMNMESTKDFIIKIYILKNNSINIDEEEYLSNNNVNKYKTIYFVNRGTFTT